MSLYITPDYVKPSDYTHYANNTYFSSGKIIEFPSNDTLWNTFFNDYLKLSESDYLAEPSYYQDMFVRYYRNFFIERTTSYGENAETIKINSDAWGTFLENSDLSKRQNAPLMWAFNILLNFVPELQDFIKEESNRVSFLTTVQSAAIDTLSSSALSLLPITSGTETGLAQENVNRSAKMQVILARKDLASAHSQRASKQVESGNSALSSVNTIMSSIMQNMKDILNRLIQ